MKTVAVIGLGIMGRGIAENFLKHDYKVVVWNRTPEKVEDLITRGAVKAESVQEAVRQANVVFEVTANDESSRAVWIGEAGILSSVRPEQSVITCATLSAGWTDELAAHCANAGLTFFDMPMTGGRMAAESGQLTLLAGGDQAKLNEIREDLKAIAKDVKYFGPAGSGMRYKLILNTLQAIHMVGFGEVLRMAKDIGLQTDLVADALAERPGGAVTGFAREAYRKDLAQANFFVEWMAKDLGYASDMTKTISHPLLDDALDAYKQAIEKGYAQADWTKVNKL